MGKNKHIILKEFESFNDFPLNPTNSQNVQFYSSADDRYYGYDNVQNLYYAIEKESSVFLQNKLFFSDYATVGQLANYTYDYSYPGYLTGNAFQNLTNQSSALGQTPVVGDIVLVKDQSDKTHNGLYVINHLGNSFGSTPRWSLQRLTYYNNFIGMSTVYSERENKYYYQTNPGDASFFNVGYSEINYIESFYRNNFKDSVVLFDHYCNVNLPGTYASGDNVEIPGLNATITGNLNDGITDYKSGSYENGQTILVNGQSSAIHNGLYHIVKPGGFGSQYVLKRAIYDGSMFLKKYVCNGNGVLEFGKQFICDSDSLKTTYRSIGNVYHGITFYETGLKKVRISTNINSGSVVTINFPSIGNFEYQVQVKGTLPSGYGVIQPLFLGNFNYGSFDIEVATTDYYDIIIIG